MLQFFTSWGPKGESLGQRMLRSFCEHHDYPITVYLDGDAEMFDAPSNVSFRAARAIAGFSATCATYKHIPICSDGKDWTRQAAKWIRKGLVTSHALRTLPGLVFWLDADTEFQGHMPEARLREMLDGVYLCYMDRQEFLPCTSFVGWDTRHPQHMAFVARYDAAWRTGRFLLLPAWTDTAVLPLAIHETQVPTRNLTPDARGPANVFDELWRGVGRHYKGPKRKARAEVPR